jgi:lysozyme
MYLSGEIKKKVSSLIANDEGFSQKVYTDTKGFLTIGFGFNLNTQPIPIGIALEWLDILLLGIEYKLEENIVFWDSLNDARKYVLINMAYQMGIGGLFGFHDMLKALGSKDYEGASTSMKDSVWYREFTARASRLIKIMQSGEF